MENVKNFGFSFNFIENSIHMYAGFWVRGLVLALDLVPVLVLLLLLLLLIQVNLKEKVTKSGCARSNTRLREIPYTYMNLNEQKKKPSKY